MKVGFAKLKFKSSMYKSCLQMFKAHFHSKIKEKEKQSCCGEQVRKLSENHSMSLGAAHWAGGAMNITDAVHWASDSSSILRRHNALGWMRGAHNQQA